MKDKPDQFKPKKDWMSKYISEIRCEEVATRVWDPIKNTCLEDKEFAEKYSKAALSDCLDKYMWFSDVLFEANKKDSKIEYCFEEAEKCVNK